MIYGMNFGSVSRIFKILQNDIQKNDNPEVNHLFLAELSEAIKLSKNILYFWHDTGKGLHSCSSQ